MSWLSAGVVWYAAHSDKVNPVVAGLGGAALVWAAIQQARTATRRHYEQTRADQQRRLTESFSKAVEQLSSDEMVARLGGIYTLERLAIEAIAQVRSPPWWRRLRRNDTPPADPVSDLYWTVMETLTAFVRERTRPDAERLTKPHEERIAESAYLLWKNAGTPEGRRDEFWSEAVDQEARREQPATDIAAVLQVLLRRSDAGREREKRRDWCFDLRTTDLRGAYLSGAHLERASLSGAHLERAGLSAAHLERAYLSEAHLERADLSAAHLERAYLSGAHLERADLSAAHLERAYLSGAHLERADLSAAHLEGATLYGAHLEGANLLDAHLEGADLTKATGDARTRLPEGFPRPTGWPAYAPD